MAHTGTIENVLLLYIVVLARSHCCYYPTKPFNGSPRYGHHSDNDNFSVDNRLRAQVRVYIIGSCCLRPCRKTPCTTINNAVTPIYFISPPIHAVAVAVIANFPLCKSYQGVNQRDICTVRHRFRFLRGSQIHTRFSNF